MSENLKTESSWRSAIKGISWRFIGTVDTILISNFVSGNSGIALKIGTSELLTKFILYFLHERAWNFALGEAPSKAWQSILKSITWRFIGTADTILLAWYFTGDWLIGMQIGSIELATKIILYYFHERLWNRVSLGTIRKIFKRSVKK